MRVHGIVFTAVLLLIVLVPARNAAAVTLQDAKNVFNGYQENIGNLKTSIELFDQVIRDTPAPGIVYQAYWMESRAYATMGDHPVRTRTNPLDDYEAGKRCAARAIQVNPDGEKGYFWYAVNLGKAGHLQGVLHALFMLPEFFKYMDRAYQLDPHDPWVLVAYGALYYHLPWFVGGNNDKALGYFRQALAADPNFTVAMVFIGRIYIREDRHKEARQVLEKVVHYTTPASKADWSMSDVPAAQKLLESIRETNDAPAKQ